VAGSHSKKLGYSDKKIPGLLTMQEAAEDIYLHPYTEDQMPHAYEHITELQKRPVKPAAKEVVWKWDVLRTAS
jgi:hypothetical protein